MDQRIVGGVSISVPRGYGKRLGPEPTGHCYICDEPLYGTELGRARHYRKCFAAHESEIMAAKQVRDRRMRVFDEDEWTAPDLQAHLKRVGKRMREEGRLEMKESERVRNE